jgi:hypothetical protein
VVGVAIANLSSLNFIATPLLAALSPDKMVNH